MRLDVYLVKNGYFSSRNQAQEAILRGDILVNGKIIKKFSYKIKQVDNIEIVNSEKPRGYWKLKMLEERFKIFKTGQRYSILDLGSSRGGFLMYAGLFANKILGIEISKQFENNLISIVNQLKRNGVMADIWFEDIFKVNTEKINKFFNGKIDILLADLTLEPQISWEGVKRYLSLLNSGSKIIWIHKGKKNIYKNFGENIKVLDYFESEDREEIYFYLMIE